MSTKFKAAVTVSLITPVLTELFTANMGPADLANPVAFFLLGFLGYGAPVLLIRELAIRWRVGLPGLFLMGLAYSILNEGIFAKTMFYGPPGGGLQEYAADTVLGLHLPWTALISTFHALHAVVFPLALTTALFPSVREEPWLTVPARIILSLLVVTTGTFGFLKFHTQYATAGNLIGCLVVMAALIGLAGRLPSQRPFFAAIPPTTLSPLLLGMLFYPLLFLGFFILAAVRAPCVVAASWPFALVGLAFILLRRKRWDSFMPLAYWALGNYSLGSLLNMSLNLRRGRFDRAVMLLVMFLMLASVTLIAIVRRRRPAPSYTGEGE